MILREGFYARCHETNRLRRDGRGAHVHRHLRAGAGGAETTTTTTAAAEAAGATTSRGGISRSHARAGRGGRNRSRTRTWPDAPVIARRSRRDDLRLRRTGSARVLDEGHVDSAGHDLVRW